MMMYQPNLKFLREPQVAILTGLSKSTRWCLEKNGELPKRRQLLAKSVGWLASEVESWVHIRNTIVTTKNITAQK